MSTNHDKLPYNDYLMEVVKRYPAIYDKSSQGYKDKTVKQDAWEQVAKEADNNVLDVQKRYNTIRTRLSKYLNKRQLSADMVTDDVLKPELLPLTWLIPFIEHRNYKPQPKRPHYSDDEEEIKNSDLDHDDMLLPTQVPNMSSVKMRTLFDRRPSELLFTESAKKMKAGTELQQKDYDQMFCASLIPKFAALNDDQREYAQIEILQVLRKARLMSTLQLTENASQLPQQYRQHSPPCPPLQSIPQQT